MFTEYRDLISELKTSHGRFRSLFDKHNELDAEIIRIAESSSDDIINKMKVEKLALKDEIYKILQEESNK